MPEEVASIDFTEIALESDTFPDLVKEYLAKDFSPENISRMLASDASDLDKFKAVRFLMTYVENLDSQLGRMLMGRVDESEATVWLQVELRKHVEKDKTQDIWAKDQAGGLNQELIQANYTFIKDTYEKIAEYFNGYMGKMPIDSPLINKYLALVRKIGRKIKSVEDRIDNLPNSLANMDRLQD